MAAKSFGGWLVGWTEGQNITLGYSISKEGVRSCITCMVLVHPGGHILTPIIFA